jgi:hypothetical protein
MFMTMVRYLVDLSTICGNIGAWKFIEINEKIQKNSQTIPLARIFWGGEMVSWMNDHSKQRARKMNLVMKDNFFSRLVSVARPGSFDLPSTPESSAPIRCQRYFKPTTYRILNIVQRLIECLK